MAVAVHEMIWRPRPGKLHPALLHHLQRRGIFVLVPLNGLVVDQVGDIQQHLARVCPLAGNFLLQRGKHTVHLYRERTRPGLALTLAAGAFPQPGQIFLAHAVRHSTVKLARTGVIHQYLQVHLSLAVEPFQIGQEVALVGADGPAQSFIICKYGVEAEGKNGGKFEAVADYARVIHRRLLWPAFCEIVIGIMFGNDDGQVAGGKKKCLISKDAIYLAEGNWLTMTGKFRES